MSYLYVILQSTLVELPVYIWLLPELRLRIGPRRSFLSILLLNTITHPFVFFFLMNLPLSYLENILLTEGFAILAETLILWKVLRVSAKRASLASLAANLVSWQLGPVLTYLLFR